MSDKPAVIKEIEDIMNKCSNIDINNPSTFQKCFNGVNNFSCDDIKEGIKYEMQKNPIQPQDIKNFETYAETFNLSKDIINDGVSAVASSIIKLRCLLDTLNSQVLKDSDIKFDVSEVDNIKNKMIEGLGGATNKKYMITLVLLIIMTLVVIGLLFKMFYKRKLY